MEITSRQVYTADPTTVVTMLCQREFLEDLCRRTGAGDSSVEVVGYTTRVSMTLPPPEGAARFVGSSMEIIETVEWGDPEPDGGRHGVLRVDVDGLPIHLVGTAVARPDGVTTVIDYHGELVAKIPLVARQVEQVAAPAVTDALEVQEQLGNEWLAARA